MPDQQISCMVCHTNFVYTEREHLFMQDLYEKGKVDEVCPPKRCAPCRQQKKRAFKPAPGTIPFGARVETPPLLQAVSTGHPPMVSAREELRDVEYEETPAPAPASAPPAVKYDPAPIEPDLRLVLVAGEFERLVCGEEVVVRLGNRKVTIVMANIGLPAMKSAMEKAVLAWWKA